MEETNLKAAELVSKHKRTQKVFYCEEVARIMRNNNLTVEDIQEYLGKPSSKDKMKALKAKLFRGSIDPMTNEINEYTPSEIEKVYEEEVAELKANSKVSGKYRRTAKQPQD